MILLASTNFSRTTWSDWLRLSTSPVIVVGAYSLTRFSISVVVSVQPLNINKTVTRNTDSTVEIDFGMAPPLFGLLIKYNLAPYTYNIPQKKRDRIYRPLFYELTLQMI
jgi:hypothetical protein